MTSTPFNVGLLDDARRSSRVLRPPGGGHTDIFGGEPEPTRGRRPAPSTIIEAHPQPVNGNEAENQNGQTTPTAPQEEPTIPAATQEAKTEHVKTDIPDKPPMEQPKTEAPKRVRVPPGGFTTRLW